jgi:nucleotide-binding universal stress UspA family protein
MFKHLLIPLDGSHMAEAALPAAETIAHNFHARVTLLHIVEANAPKEVHGERHWGTPQEALKRLREVAKTDFPHEIQVETQIRQESSTNVAHQIAETARDLNADCIVMCTHGRGGLRHRLFGNIAQKVLASAVIPILLVPPRDNVERPFSCQRLMVPLDGNPDHEVGLQAATRLAKSCGSEIHILYVVRTSKTLTKKAAASAKWMPNAAKFLEKLRKNGAENYLQHHIEGLKTESIPVKGEVRFGDPIQVVVQASKEKNIDMIVLGTHGLHGATAFWSESVTPRLSNQSHIPLLLIPAHRP